MTRSLIGSLLVLAAFAACKDGSGPPPVGPPAALVVVSGGGQSAFANTIVPSPIQMAVRDANGRGVAGHTVTFVALGGGFLEGTTTATSDENGMVTAPAWRLSKLASLQTLRATLNALTVEVPATVRTFFDIDVRFWGDQEMSPANKALFTIAAQRIEGIVTGDVIDIDASTADPTLLEEACGVTGQQLPARIDDIIIYARIVSIDGPGKVIARAGFCLGRDVEGVGFMPGVGVMEFDSDDLSASLQDVITHEMLHVVGVGTLWDFDRTLITGAGTSNPRFTGAQGRAACVAFGGTVSCSTDVPVEGEGGPGTADGHWDEQTFNTELMTGFIENINVEMPLSSLTIGSLADVGYTINAAANDAFIMPNPPGSLRANSIVSTGYPAWEERLDLTKAVFEPDGRVRILSRPKAK